MQYNNIGDMATKYIYFVVIQVPMVKHSNGLFLLSYMFSIFVHLLIFEGNTDITQKSPVFYSNTAVLKKANL